MCTQGRLTNVFHTYRVAGARGHSSRDSPTHTRPYPGHLRPTLGTSALPWAPQSNCSTGQAISPITIATAAHELLGGRVLAGRWQAPQGNLVTGRRHRFSNT